MATTKIKSINTSLKSSLKYILDDKKITNELVGFDLVDYSIVDPSSIETIANSFEEMRKSFMSKSKKEGYFAVQSFSPNELNVNNRKDILLAHELGIKLAKEFCEKEGYQYVLATHIDKKHIHNHIIFNSVSMKDGKAYKNINKNQKKFQEISNKLSRQYGLSEIEFNMKSKKEKRILNILNADDIIEDKIYVNSKLSPNFDVFIKLMKEDKVDLKIENDLIYFKEESKQRYRRKINNKEVYYKDLKEYIESKSSYKKILENKFINEFIKNSEQKNIIQNLLKASNNIEEFNLKLCQNGFELKILEDEVQVFDKKTQNKITFNQIITKENLNNVFKNTTKNDINIDNNLILRNINSLLKSTNTIDEFSNKLKEFDLKLEILKDKAVFINSNNEIMNLDNKIFPISKLEEMQKNKINVFTDSEIEKKALNEIIRDNVYKNMAISDNFSSFRKNMEYDNIEVDTSKKYLRFKINGKSNKFLRARTNGKYFYQEEIEETIKKIKSDQTYKNDFIESFINSNYSEHQMLGHKVSKKKLDQLNNLILENKKLYQEAMNIKNSIDYRDLYKSKHMFLGNYVNPIKENLLVKEGYFRWAKKNNFFVKMNIRNKMLEDYGIKDQEELIKKYIDNEKHLKNIYKDNRYLFGEIKKIKKEIASLKRIKGEVSINRSITLYEQLNKLQKEININNKKINEFKIENVDIVIMDKKLNEIEEVEDNTYERIQAEREKQREREKEQEKSKRI